MRKKKLSKAEKKKLSNTLLIDKKAYLAGVKALKAHIEEIMSEYERLRQEFGTTNHPILHGLLQQAQLINDISSCFESGLVYGDAGDNLVTRYYQ